MVCDRFLGRTIQPADAVAQEQGDVREKLRKLFEILYRERRRVFLDERPVHGLVAVVALQNWPCVSRHLNKLVQIIERIVRSDVDSGRTDASNYQKRAKSALYAFSHLYKVTKMRAYPVPLHASGSVARLIERSSSNASRSTARQLFYGKETQTYGTGGH